MLKIFLRPRTFFQNTVVQYVGFWLVLVIGQISVYVLTSDHARQEDKGEREREREIWK